MEDVFLRVLNMGITAGYCVLVLLFVRLFLKKLPKIYSYALWSVVYFRLLCPFSIKSVFSLLGINPQTVPSDIGMQPLPHITSGMTQMDAVINTGLAQAAPTPAASVNPMQVIVYGATVIWGLNSALRERRRPAIFREDLISRGRIITWTAARILPSAWQVLPRRISTGSIRCAGTERLRFFVSL